jgi:hypothetical protein
MNGFNDSTSTSNENDQFLSRKQQCLLERCRRYEKGDTVGAESVRTPALLKSGVNWLCLQYTC